MLKFLEQRYFSNRGTGNALFLLLQSYLFQRYSHARDTIPGSEDDSISSLPNLLDLFVLCQQESTSVAGCDSGRHKCLSEESADPVHSWGDQLRSSPAVCRAQHFCAMQPSRLQTKAQSETLVTTAGQSQGGSPKLLQDAASTFRLNLAWQNYWLHNMA